MLEMCIKKSYREGKEVATLSSTENAHDETTINCEDLILRKKIH